MRAPDGSPERTVSEVAVDVERTRAELGNYLAEIERRRHDALDWRLQLSRHRIPVTLAGSGVAAAVGYALAALLQKRRR